VYGEVLSFVVYVMYSVPQGSVLGPLFFILYTVDLAGRAVKYGVSLHAYADDTQLQALPSRRNGVIRRSSSMFTNRLKLNADKTELLFASSGHCCAALKSSLPDAEIRC